MQPENDRRKQLAAVILAEDNAGYLLSKRYLDNEAGETQALLYRRVAAKLAENEIQYGGPAAGKYWQQKFLLAMKASEFLPNSPVLLNAGRFSRQNAACFCVPVGNNLDSALEALENAKLIHQRGSGTAFSFSQIPADSNTGRHSEPLLIRLLGEFSRQLLCTRQGGIRCGCNTAILNVNHPGIFEFIRAKEEPDKLNNFYLSVALNDEFMQALAQGEDFNLVDPSDGTVTTSLPAGNIFEAIIESSWKNGDPGIIFFDRIQKSNPTPHLGRIETVSGCGEHMMLAHEGCFLGSVNLARMLKNGPDGQPVIDWKKLDTTVGIGVRMLDNALETSSYPTEQAQRISKQTRKIGLGIMGLASMFYELGVAYNSCEAISTADALMRYIQTRAYEYSQQIAVEKGAFPAIRLSGGVQPRRNASLTTIAPTGTLSLLAGCSAGIEPVYRLLYLRRIQNGRHLLEVNPQFYTAALRNGVFSRDLATRMIKGESIHKNKSIPDSMKRIFVTALDINPEWHLQMQATLQNHTDNAVSKTVNLPAGATRQEVARIYLEAYRKGLKGVTVYRDSSRQKQPLDAGEEGVAILSEWLDCL
ncbi:MAG: ribonucleoside-diphosphate reductase, adenosylcobalamin-dependent [Dehalococcoidaceae bacterium]|nr:ribonucleoside-diphosphate reductase, adenosylcobalamin-dependent [Dehalococcoidaceae bacterium]